MSAKKKKSPATSPRRSGGVHFRLGVTHVVILLGVVLGSLTAAFFLGYRSGLQTRIENQIEQSFERAGRMPIPDEEMPKQVPERLVEEVYAKLRDDSTPIRTSGEPQQPPQLAPIKVVPSLKRTDETLGDLGVRNRGGEGPKKIARNPSDKKTGAPSDDSATSIAASVNLGDLEEGAAQGVHQKPSELQKDNKREPKKQVAGVFELGNSPSGSTRTPIVKEKVEKTPRRLEPPKAVAAVAAATPAPKVKEPSNEVDGIPTGWYVQLAALESKTEADTLVSKLSQNGFREVKVQIAVVKGKRYYRVLVGPEETTLLARRLQEQLVREPYIKFKPYLKRVQ